MADDGVGGVGGDDAGGDGFYGGVGVVDDDGFVGGKEHGHVVEVVAEGHDAVGSGDAFEIEEALGFGYAGGEYFEQGEAGVVGVGIPACVAGCGPADGLACGLDAVGGADGEEEHGSVFEACGGGGVEVEGFEVVEGAVGDEAVFDWGEEGSVVVDDDGVGAARQGVDEWVDACGVAGVEDGAGMDGGKVGDVLVGA